MSESRQPTTAELAAVVRERIWHGGARHDDGHHAAVAALDALAARCEQLERERDEAETRRYEEHILVSTHSVIVGNLNREREAAERRVGQLEAALRRVESILRPIAESPASYNVTTAHIDAHSIARDALEGDEA